jgi:rfaE bifunctional protein nucleotidyltransferase chain/domain
MHTRLLIARGMPTTKTIFTNGCFDILHRGHFELLKYCHSLGHVVVGLNSNTSVKRLKGVNRPFFDEGDREFALRSCRFVDNVIIFAEDTPLRLITELQPDIIVKGGDYNPDEVVGSNLCEVRIFNYIEGYSTTKVLENQ